MIKRKFARLPKYFIEFGCFEGVKLWASIEKEMPKQSTNIREFRCAKYSAPIYLRDSIGDHATFWQCVVQNQYNFLKFDQSGRLIKFYQNALDNGEEVLIIDCGGNIGLSTLWFAKQFPEAYIYTIEPDSANVELLKKNTAHLGGKVNVLHGAIWNRSSELKITNPEAGSAAFRVVEVENAQADNEIIAGYTIQNICDMANVDAPLIVKIDIEGGQASLFSSNTEWVKQTHLIALELDDWLLPWQGTSRSFFSCLSNYRFEYLMSGEIIYCFQDFYPNNNTEK